MAKKKKRHIRKRHKKLSATTSILNRHHLLWMRKMWYGGSLRSLRDYYYNIILLPKDTLHKTIHERIPYIPTPKPAYAHYVLDELKKLDEVGAISENDGAEKRLSVLICFFDCIEQKTADALWEQLKIVREYNKGRW